MIYFTKLLTKLNSYFEIIADSTLIFAILYKI